MEQTKITYEASKGEFTIMQNSMLWRLFFGNNIIHEKDISIAYNNQLRKASNSTVLTSSDIDLLYGFAKKRFKYANDRQAFEIGPLKYIFTDMSDDMNLGNLLIRAHNYFNLQL